LIIFMILPIISDDDSFEYIYTTYKRLMMKKAYSILRDYSLAEDAVSEACIRIFKNIRKIDDPASSRSVAFVMMIVKNTSLTVLQNNKKYYADELDETIEDSYNLESSVVNKMSSEEIYKTLGTLDEESRNIFLYKYAYDLPHKEIASIMDLSENNVTVKLHRCKKKLVSLLSREEDAK
jgi:RNA polymerase sigma factor, sigma-70 family